MPNVSVLMPVRNGARWLREAIDSVLGQTLRDFELIVVDDGSTDDTPHLLSDVSRLDSRIRIFRQEASGLVDALNRGLAEARGSLVARLDADDRAMPERLDRQVRYLESNPNVGLLGSWAEKIDERGAPCGLLKPEPQSDALAHLLLRTNPFVHSSVMFRTEPVRRLGGYRSAFQAAEDYDLWLRIAEVAEIVNVPEFLIQYRRHNANVTQRHAIRQAFSARLAQRSANIRRETGNDPAGHLISPPDWRSEEKSFYAEDAALYRLLDIADPTAATNTSFTNIDFSTLCDRINELRHTERKLAALSIIRYLKRAPSSQIAPTLRALLSLLSRRPGMIGPIIAAIRQT
jgi:glycosyltransferase involved in cell wall biosynthesis